MQHLLYLTITIISLSYASPTSPTDSSQPHPCNSCCQGPSGLPGIPGTSGHYGLPGRDGLRDDIGSTGLDGEKGDVGSSGLRGETGLVGPQGLSGGKGDRGLRGLPGKVGPQGLKGSAGVDGHDLSGEKGELGQKGEPGGRIGRSAFTAVKTSVQTGNANDVLTFQKTLTNVGNNFNVGTSRFTCQIPGVYWFTFTMGRQTGADPHVYLVKDGTNIVIAEFYDSPNYFLRTQTTNGAVLELAAGEQVWVKFGSTGQQVYSTGAHFTSFSGFFLYEI